MSKREPVRREERVWQPIETAPRDRNGDVQPVQVGAPGYLPQTGYTVAGAWEMPGTGGDLPFEPTHWMPLPEPPR